MSRATAPSKGFMLEKLTIPHLSHYCILYIIMYIRLKGKPSEEAMIVHYVGPETPGIYFSSVTFHMTIFQYIFKTILEMVLLR